MSFLYQLINILTIRELVQKKKKVNLTISLIYLCQAGISSEEYLNVFDHVLKKLEDFNPEFILISAGFDAHEDDPLAQFNLKTDDYYTITKRILETSKKFCNGKVVSILEGGYDLKALQDSTKRHVDALLEFN